MAQKTKDFIAYDGEVFTIEWYFSDGGRSNALEYFETLSLERKKKLFKLMRKLGDFGKIFNQEQFRNEGDQIYAFKPQPDRFLCFFFDGAKVIITNAFEKKANKLPLREKQKALKAKEDFLTRSKKGTYYE